MSHVLIVVNEMSSNSADASYTLSAYFSSLGIQSTTVSAHKLALNESNTTFFDEADLPQDTILAIALGGDGTILRTARLIKNKRIPILGINFGHLGFLANSGDNGLVPIVAAALSGDVVEDKRTNLIVNIQCEGDEELGVPEGEIRTFFALNEIAITRGASGRMLDFGLEISGDFVYATRGDGITISSATGSSAYALSAGGPLVSPRSRCMLAVPLLPHSLQSRAIVTEPQDTIEIDLTRDPEHSDTMLFLDGDALIFSRTIERIVVNTGSTPTTLLRYKQESFYSQISRVFFKQ